MLVSGQGLSRGRVAGVAAIITDEGVAAGNLHSLVDTARTRYEHWAANDALPSEARELALVYLSLIEDPSLLSLAQSKVDAGVSVPEAVVAACQELCIALEALKNKYLRERAKDLTHLAHDLLSLTGAHTGGTIWLVNKLTPTLIFSAKEQGAVGLICNERLPASGHLAILARSLNLVLVGGVQNLDQLDQLVVTIDGESGAISLGDEGQDIDVEIFDTADLPLWINVSSSGEIEATPSYRGVGLYRTEFIYLRGGSVPTPKAELAEYVRALQAANGRPVVFRLLDFGADKPLPGSPQSAEPNPMLGKRGVRLLLEQPHLLQRQLELLIEASTHGDLRMMVPMVTSLGEMKQVRGLLEDLGGGHLPLGAMIETPAAALLSRELCEISDFLSIGTNDLAAYIYASDRLNTSPEALDDHTALLRLISLIAQGARAGRRSLGVCGEMAADPRLAPELLRLGCDYLSVSVQGLKAVAHVLR